MKRFNLQEYLKNPDRKIITRNGKSVRIICVNKLDCRYPVVALVRVCDDCENTGDYTEDGWFGTHGQSESDLFFVPEKKEGWINIYHYDGLENANAARRIYDTKEEALKCANKGYVDTVKIEWEE